MAQDFVDVSFGGKVEVPNHRLAEGHVADGTAHQVEVYSLAVSDSAEFVDQLELRGRKPALHQEVVIGHVCLHASHSPRSSSPRVMSLINLAQPFFNDMGINLRSRYVTMS